MNDNRKTRIDDNDQLGMSAEEINAIKASSGQNYSTKNSTVSKEFIETEFEVPTENVYLPSEGLFYPNGQSVVKIKYLTADAEDIIFSSELINSGRVLDVLLNHGIHDSFGLNPEDMLTGDRNAILVELRKTGFGEEYQSNEEVCPSCGQKHKPLIDLNDIKYKKNTEKPDSMGEYSVELPVTKKQIKFRLFTGQDEKVLSKLSGSNNKNKIKYNKIITERYIRQIMEVDGQRDKTYIKKFIGFMPLKDSAFLREYIKIVEPGLDLNVKIECDNCGHVYDKEIVLSPINLFYPDANF